MNKKIVPIVPGDLGNSKQIPPSIKWCFTWNNYPSDYCEKLIDILLINSKYIYGKEGKEEGSTPHLQGFVIFNKKIRPLSVVKVVGIHWIKAKGSVEENIAYCSKGGDWASHGLHPIVTIEPTKKWQLEIVKLLQGRPCDRVISWYWDEAGGVGKSTFSKWLCVKKQACIVGGKAHDIRHGIVGYEKIFGFYPEIVIFDIARSCNKVSYQALEEVKNGLFFSGKYEGAQCVFNSPHVIVFSNWEPEEGKLSEGRVKITDITEIKYSG